MPPKPKFSREEVIEKAFEIVRAEGESALTARRLGEALGASSRPIFTLFEGMEELKAAVRERASVFFTEFFEGYADYTPAFKKLGITIVDFADKEPNVFQFLFMSGRSESLTLHEWSRSSMGEESVSILMRDYKFDEETALVFFEEMWMHAFAMCVLRVTKAAIVTDQQVSDSLTRNFLGLMSMAKAGHLTDQGVNPIKRAQGDRSEVYVPEIPFVLPARD